MPKKDKYKYVPWLAVGLAGLMFASVGRYVILKNGDDTGTTNLIFIIVIVCTALAYIVLIAFTSSVTEFVCKLKKKGKIKAIEPESMLDQQPEETISEPETIKPVDTIVEETSNVAAKPAKPKNMAQLREEVKAKEARKKEDDIRLFQEYAHIVVGIYMTDKDVTRLDECIEMYANGEVVDEMMKPLRTEKLENADLFHFGWNMHNFFKTGDKQAIVVDWLQAVFENLRKLDYTTIIGKLKHNERNTYLIPIVKDIRGFMAENDCGKSAEIDPLKTVEDDHRKTV